MTALGIIAGGGELPVAVAKSASENGRAVVIAALHGLADKRLEGYRHQWVSPGQAGRIFSFFREHGCNEVLLAGKVARPDWNAVKFDAMGLRKLPKVMAAALKGDDALLRAFVDILEGEGFYVVSVATAAPGLLAGVGFFGVVEPSPSEKTDIDLGAKVVRALGAFDVGQAAIVCEGVVLAVEAAEGTDAMIARISQLPDAIHGSHQKRRGVLVKARKPIQDGRTDLPVIGVRTVENCAAVGLAGIAVEANSALILNRSETIASADKVGLFLFGFPSRESAA